MDIGISMEGGWLNAIPPNATPQVQIKAINDVIGRLNDLLRTQVFSDGTVKRMLFGYQQNGWGPDKNFGIKVSIEGVDVTTASDEQLLFKMAMDEWTWRNADGQLVEIFDIADGKHDYYNSDKNYMRSGVLPNGIGGVAIVKPGKNVDEAF
jgi:hypothetical protein